MKGHVQIMRIALVIVCAWLSLTSCSCCSSSSTSSPAPRRPAETSTAAPSSGIAVDDDEDDEEDAEDVEEEEDFDLICDNHVTPERIKTPPHVIIFGAKKGGTRALIEFLKLHPKIKAAGPEIHYFDKHYHQGLDWYVSKMRAIVPDSGEMAVEKTPGYFHTALAPERVRESLLPPESVKLLLIVRDPVKRLISDYNQFRSRYLDEGKNYPTLEELVFTRDEGINLDYPVLQRSIYHLHMRRWLEQFGRDQIHIVDGEKFIRTPWTELNAVEDFLGLPNLINKDNFFFNDTKGFYCSKDVRSHGAWTCTKEKCLGRSKGRPKPPVSPETLAKLTDFFAPHNKLFYDMVGQVFEWPTTVIGVPPEGQEELEED